MDLGSPELVLVDHRAHPCALGHDRTAGHHLADPLDHDREMRTPRLDRAEAGARPERDGDYRDVAELGYHQPGRVAGDLRAAHLFDQADAAAGAVDKPHQRQAVLERVVLGVDPFLRDGCVGGAAAYREVVDVQRHLAAADPGGAYDRVGRPHGDQVPVLVVLRFAGQRSDLKERSGIEICSIRSRAVSLPFCFWRSTDSAPPIVSANCLRRPISSTSRCQLIVSSRTADWLFCAIDANTITACDVVLSTINLQ